MLELAILGLLKGRPMHGYDLRKRLREDFGLLSNLSFGSLYPALARLEAAGAVQAQADSAAPTPATAPQQAGRLALPFTGSLSGERAAYRASRAAAPRLVAATRATRGTRGRKVYEITARGEELFDRLLHDQDERSEDSRTFSLRLAFARHLSPTARMRLLERRRGQLVDRLARSKSAVERASDQYERSLVEHSIETTERDIAWIDRLIEGERELRPAPPIPAPTEPVNTAT